jgi:MOSC domain-containing protein YiiM
LHPTFLGRKSKQSLCGYFAKAVFRDTLLVLFKFWRRKIDEYTMIIGKLRDVLLGQIRSGSRPNTFSAIDKHSVKAPVQVLISGLKGDEQGDSQFHGGVDKAIHCYPWEHYSYWSKALPNAVILNQTGAFGENFSTEGLSEFNVCIGDRWKIGDCHFEVSQGRQPCWKLSDRFCIENFSHTVQNSLYSGWYLRVLRQGFICSGQSITLHSRPYPQWPLKRLLQIIRDGDCDTNTLKAVLNIPLTESWHSLFQKRLETASVESWIGRLDGPPK